MVVYPLSYYSFYKIPPHIEIMILKSVSRISSELSLNTYKSPSRIISFFIYFYSHFDVFFYNSTGASDGSFYSTFNKSFDHVETLLTIQRLKKVFPAGSLCRPLVPNPQSDCPKMAFILPPKYHASVSSMLS